MIRLQRYLDKPGKRLRMGYTTGACAAGAAKAAALLLLTGTCPPTVTIDTPAGIPLNLEVEEAFREGDCARCAVRKDAGDDPDVTDGILVYAMVRRHEGGIVVEGGTGVGRVTKPGLSRPVGAAAINPTPLRMVTCALEQARDQSGAACGLYAEISVPGGEEIARKTYNPRLGIEGGISILGTSGFVEPMSEQALLDTISLELHSRRAQGQDILLLTPGNYGRDFAAAHWGLHLDNAVKCANFIGDALDMAAEGFSQVLLVGHAGKLAKLAGGIFNTHSRIADARMEILAAHAGACGLPPADMDALLECIGTDAAHDLLASHGIAQAVWDRVGERAHAHMARRLGTGPSAHLAIFGAAGLLYQSPDFEGALTNLRAQYTDERNTLWKEH